MTSEANDAKYQTRLKFITECLIVGSMRGVSRMLNNLHPAEIAKLMEALPPKQRKIAWKSVALAHEGAVLTHVNEEVRASLIAGMGIEELVEVSEGLETDDLADIFHQLPDSVISQVLHSMNAQDRRRLEAVLSYPEDTAGGLMNTDTITIRPDVTLDVVLRYLRFKGNLPHMTDSLIVVNRQDHYEGILPVTTFTGTGFRIGRRGCP